MVTPWPGFFKVKFKVKVEVKFKVKSKFKPRFVSSHFTATLLLKFKLNVN